jgi:mRNA interferase RelE/StbE
VNTYKIELSRNAEKTLDKLNPNIRKMIAKWVEKNLENTTDPKQHGKALVGELAGLWRYRVGDYRLICKIIDNKLIIYIIQVGHRSKIYK